MISADENLQKNIHGLCCKNKDKLTQWYKQKAAQLAYPIYSSYDIRDAGYKITTVDANIFPAGFNNICPTDQESAIEIFKNYFELHYNPVPQKILLITEEHTNNSYYWENVATIAHLIESSGRTVRIAFPRLMEHPLELTSSGGKKLTIYSGHIDSPHFQEFKPDLIVSNNDFSDPKNEWAHNINLPMNPPRGMGWYQRKKSTFFENYNKLVSEFCSLLDVDPFVLQVQTEIFSPFDITNDQNIEEGAVKIDNMIAQLKSDYEKRGISTQPFVFVKNNSGTYGLGVIKVNSGEEFKHLNYKSRKKMKAAKGGKEVVEVIIQEGVPSITRADGNTAEPVIYMVGCKLAGGFLRSHSEKSETESLNSPGAVYKRLCVSDLAVDVTGCPLENVYGWISKLALLAIGLEGEQMKVEYKNFIKKICTLQE